MTTSRPADGFETRAVITQHDVSGRDLLVNIAHFQRFKAAANYCGHTSLRNAFAYPTLAPIISSVGGGRRHIIISISRTAIGWWTRQV
jgi:hypothetical protein